MALDEKKNIRRGSKFDSCQNVNGYVLFTL